jgi:hypothetical protein
MADRPQVNGWNNINQNKPEEYSSEFIIGGNKFANVTNASTAQRQLYFVQPISNVRGLLTTTNADGTITKGENYDNFNQFNPGKLAAAEAASKQASVKLLSTPGISTPAEAAVIKNSKEFKSTTVGQNSASGSGTGDGISGATTQIESLSKLGAISSSSTKNRDITKYPDNQLLRYPIDLNQSEQDFISFTMLKYSPKKYTNLSSLAETGTISGRGNRTSGSTVVLPIQPAITDLNTVEWGSDSMNAPELIAASLALNTILNKPGEGGGETANNIIDLIGGAGNNDIKTAVAAKFAGEAAGTKGLLTRITGGIVNPNMELLFNGPQLRTFQLNFSLSSREPKESKNIRNIIRFFKQGMSVKRSNTDLFLQSPHTFQIKYNYKGSEHPWINKIKECALTGCTVNYTPAGSYATFIDGAMTSYEIGLQFAELEALYDDDYVPDGGKGNESEIGY